MTTLTRSSITGLYHPKRLFDEKNFESIDRILNADQSDSLRNSSRSLSSSSLNQSILETQLKRANSCNDTFEASLKRLRTETQNSIEDFKEKTETLEHLLHQSKIKISELEDLLEKSKQSTISSDTTITSISTYEQQIKTLENENFELKLQSQQNQYLHNKQVTQLEKTIHDLRHQLIDRDNQLKLIEFERDKLSNINKTFSNQLNDKTEQIDDLQKRLTELESLISKSKSINSNVKQTQDIRFENEQLKKEIELLKLKCNERILHDEELRNLRKQIQINEDYRMIIAKKDAEILKLREKSGK